jgi:hypothetical protein
MKAGILLLALLASEAAGQEAAHVKEPLMHTKTSFTVIVHASYADAAPLFGPEGERLWVGKHWDPKFVYPLSAHDEEGAVFTVKHGPFTAVWVNTAFDVAGRHFQYVYFMPEVMATVIDLRFKVLDAATTQVDVVYARTALSTAGNEHVAAMTEGDRSAGPDWQKAIDACLEKRKSTLAP